MMARMSSPVFRLSCITRRWVRQTAGYGSELDLRDFSAFRRLGYRVLMALGLDDAIFGFRQPYTAADGARRSPRVL